MSENTKGNVTVGVTSDGLIHIEDEEGDWAYFSLENAEFIRDELFVICARERLKREKKMEVETLPSVGTPREEIR